MRPPALLAAILSTALLLSAAAQAATGPSPSAQVAWSPAAAATDVARLQALSRSSTRPLLLYWGATWCPPCNQLKATLFNRQDFAALARSYVMVHVDGDRPGAQVLGQRFKVGGYPTLVLFRPDGQELTRLPGEAEPEQVLELMRQGLAGGRPVAAVLADARAGKPLKAAEWRQLAFYSWDTDDDRLLSGSTEASVLASLAPAAGPGGAAPEVVDRLWLRALAASDEGQGVKSDDALRERIRDLLFDPTRARVVADLLVNRAASILRGLGETAAQRQPFLQPMDALLRRWQADPSLSRPDQASALISRIELARIELPRRELRPSLPEALQSDVRDFASRADQAIADPYERQAVIPAMAYALERVGLWAEAESLLLGNLARSHSAYYLMSQLGGLHRKLGRNDEALRWYAKSFDSSQGPATRLQWGSGYLRALVELSPADAARIESVAAQLLDEASRDRGAFHKRSARSLQRMGKSVGDWAQAQGQAPVLKRLRARLDAVCRKVDAADGARERCKAVLPARAA